MDTEEGRPYSSEKELRKEDHVQPEGFCLMHYQCTKGHREIIWNSRPYITPFIIACKCNAPMSHVDWKMDRYDPQHSPLSGDRIFVDLTPDLALPIAQELVEKNWNNPNCPMSEVEHFSKLGKHGAIDYFVKSWCEEYGGHNPYIITVS